MKVSGLISHTVVTTNRHATSLRVQAVFETEPLARTGRQRINEPETGVVTVAQVFGPGIAEAGDESDARHG